MNKDIEQMDFQAGEVLLFDKPYGWTSFDVVRKARYAIKKKLKVKKIKVGHAGTLDPLATGLLVLCTGRKTKEIQLHMDGNKTYTGSITFGASRPSYDMETEIDEEFPTDHITSELLEAAKEKLSGEYLQEPPKYSAKMIDGKRAYVLARKGEDFKMNRNLINVISMKFTKVELPLVEFEIVCSKGTYIRSIANDFGKLVNSGAYLSSLRRTSSGDHDVANAIDLERFTSVLMDDN